MNKKQSSHSSLALKSWVRKHTMGLLLLLSISSITLLIYLFGWWETLGILFLKFGLGAKVAGAKTFAHAIIKAGGKKAIAMATAGMLAKRHIIDIVSQFFTKYSVSRYKKTILLVLKKKINEIRQSNLAKKLQALGSTLLSIPMVYFFWTKVLGTAIQKFVYTLMLPLFTLVWNFILTSFNFINFLLQVLMLNLLLDTLSRYKIGQKIIEFIDDIVMLMGKILNLFNSILKLIGINPKALLIKLSNRFNRWLESILDKGLNPISKLENKRARYINTAEKISERRYLTAQNRSVKKISQWSYVKKLYEKKVLKRRNWRSNREQRIQNLQRERKNSPNTIRKKLLDKRKKRSALCLPYHIKEHRKLIK